MNRYISLTNLLEFLRDNTLNYKIAMEKSRQAIDIADEIFHSINDSGPHMVHVEWINDIPKRDELVSIMNKPFLARGFGRYKCGYRYTISEIETWPMIWAAIKRRLKLDLGDRRGWLVKNGQE